MHIMYTRTQTSSTHLILLGALLLHGLDGVLVQRPAEREERHEDGPRDAPRVDPMGNRGRAVSQ